MAVNYKHLFWLIMFIILPSYPQVYSGVDQVEVIQSSADLANDQQKMEGEPLPM